MINFLNKQTKKLTDFFKHDIEMDTPQISNIADNIIYLNSQLVLWRHDINHEDESLNQIFTFRFNQKFMIYNLTARKIQFKTNTDKILDFKTPSYPSYTLEFLLSFAISAKNWLSNDSYNILIIHDELKEPKVLSLLCSILSYFNKTAIHPMDLYANIISTNKAFAELANISVYKNILRYLNYFSMIQNNPIFEFKRIFMKSLIISSAPAIENIEKEKKQHYITINDKSFFSPVIRLLANDKVIYCSYKK